MTGEEMERAIEFLLSSQANFDARLEETNRQIAATNQQLQAFAESQSQIIQIVTSQIVEQRRLNEELQRRDAELSAELRRRDAELRRRDVELREDYQRGAAELREEYQRGTAELREEYQRGSAELRAALRELATAQARAEERARETDERLRRTDANVNSLADTVRLHVEAGGESSRG